MSQTNKSFKRKVRKQYKQFFYIMAISLIIGFIAGISVNYQNIRVFIDNIKLHNSPGHDPILIGSSEIELCFTPPSGCAAKIAKLISEAKESVYVQAYGFTSNQIVGQLIDAHNRGVEVRILLDESNLASKYSRIRQMTGNGIDVSIDKVPGIAHNKVIILDRQKVVTGSFNFTNSADTRNAENIIIVNDKEIAKRYLQNWFFRKSSNAIAVKYRTIKHKELEVADNVK